MVGHHGGIITSTLLVAQSYRKHAFVRVDNFSFSALLETDAFSGFLPSFLSASGGLPGNRTGPPAQSSLAPSAAAAAAADHLSSLALAAADRAAAWRQAKSTGKANYPFHT